MDFVTPLLELVKNLWGPASKSLGYICNLKDNVRSLDKANEKLKALREDVKGRVEREEAEGGQRTNQVVNWLGEVQEFVGGADQVLEEAGEHDRITCLGRCLPWNSWSSYKLGKRVDEKRIGARELQTEGGKLDVLTSRLPPPPVLEMPEDDTVGLDISKFEKVWKWLVDEKQVGVIGLYGTGGVGKTTLMKRINQELARANHGFQVVIWVVVSRQVNEDKIQEVIRRRLDIRDELWDRWPGDQKIHRLWEVLTHKKFVLLIDDVWARLDLPDIGVPRPDLNNGSKVIFTTRSKQVCHQMGADKICEVQCLMPIDALELFENNVGKLIVHSHPEIQELAKDIARECKGLPLALITVGRAMAGRPNPGEWNFALTTLRSNPYKLSSMVEEVYHVLEFSYHSLSDPTSQCCFLYCCLFPEDYLIRPHNLIELWIGEGLLGDTDDVYDLRHKGEYVLGSLKLACLLESDDERGYVKMHDVIRDMATWIAHDRGQRENKWLVIENKEHIRERMSKWGEAEKVSLWRIDNINQAPPQCSRLKTLFVRETNVTFMPRGFFDSMKACLTVLDLSDNRHIQLFPEEICNLINLWYLNLSNTGIDKLPWEIKNLTCLRWLLLDEIVRIQIPTEAITSLPLIVFSQWSSNTNFWQSSQVEEEEMVGELKCMQHLIDLSIRVFNSSSALEVFQYLSRCIRRAWISNKDLTSIEMSCSTAGSEGFPRLEVLHLYNCFALKKMEITRGIERTPRHSCFPRLVSIRIQWCGLLDLSWLVHAPVLQELRLMECKSMGKIIGDGFAPGELAASKLFSRLETLHIDGLPNLTSICDQTLSFPLGASFGISGCPRLTKLPLDWNSSMRRFSVYADAHWWAKFECDRTTRVALKLGESAAETTFGEAVRKMKDESVGSFTLEFCP